MPNRGRNGKKPKPDKIHDALSLLNEAAREKQNEIYHALGDRYGRLKGVFQQASSDGRHAVTQARDKAGHAIHDQEVKVRKKAADADRRVHERPWTFMGGVAVASFALGYLVSRNQSMRRALKGPR